MNISIKEIVDRLDEIDELMEIMNFRSESQDLRILENFLFIKNILEDVNARKLLEGKKGYKKVVDRFNLLSLDYDPIEPLN
jgi:hypothetical protein